MSLPAAISDGGVEFTQPWMPPRTGSNPDEAPEFMQAERSKGGPGVGIGTASSSVGGAAVGLPVTSQGGGAASGISGGIGVVQSTGNWALAAAHRGLFGGSGTRTGGSY